MKSQAYRMAMLYDFYGDVLTERQKEFYDLYYNEDLSLGEIAENYGITRQGVRDVIVRAEAVLTELEDKTGLIKRFHTMHGQLEQIAQDAQRIRGAGRSAGQQRAGAPLHSGAATPPRSFWRSNSWHLKDFPKSSPPPLKSSGARDGCPRPM